VRHSTLNNSLRLFARTVGTILVQDCLGFWFKALEGLDIVDGSVDCTVYVDRINNKIAIAIIKIVYCNAKTKIQTEFTTYQC